jgi:cytoskeleton protein RodZ
MESVGEILRDARQTQGLDLTSVAALTKINLRYLEAIEADDRQQLPSSFFYRSFVHQYATALGLDAHQVDAEVDRLLSADAPLPLPGQASSSVKSLPPVTETNRFQVSRTVTSLAALVLVMVACSGVYALWRKSRDVVPAAEDARAMSPATRTTAYQQPSKTAPPVSASAQALEAIPGYKVLVDLMAREETWLSVYSDGKKVFSGILAANQSKSIEGRESAKVTMGNAAGLEVRLNGKLLDPLGTRGQVLTVLFTSDKFQVFPQQPKSDSQPKPAEVGEF